MSINAERQMAVEASVAVASEARERRDLCKSAVGGVLQTVSGKGNGEDYIAMAAESDSGKRRV